MTITKYLEKASKAYYEGNPIISDAEYDALENLYGNDKVGYSATGTIPHLFRMWSLQKCYDMSEAPINYDINSIKLDGAAISIAYSNKELILALTRGDGVAGQDITDKIRHLVPNKIELDGLVQVTGEVVAPSSIPNSRNYASGALNLKSVEEFKSRELYFIAYGLESNIPFNTPTWSGLMDILDDRGFNTVLHLGSSVETLPSDGVVFRIDNLKEFAKLGYTSKHPRGAFALKENKEGVITTLLDVDWQVGRTGLISPVAILEPVMIGDAKVSRATLHNIEYIRALNLEIGCEVEVIRAGEIIPRVIRRV